MNELNTYRKKPVEIQAVRFGGSSTEMNAIRHWMEGHEYVSPGLRTSDMRMLEIETLEGVMKAAPGDYIIKGVAGEFYPCKPDIFEATYELCESVEGLTEKLQGLSQLAKEFGEQRNV